MRMSQLPVRLAVGITGHRGGNPALADGSHIAAALAGIFAEIEAALAAESAATPALQVQPTRLHTLLAHGVDQMAASETPSAVIFTRKMPLVSPLLRTWHCAAPQNRHKAYFALVSRLPARSLFPETAARCAIDPTPPSRYSFASQDKSRRRVNPT